MKKQELKKGLWGLIVILCASLSIFIHTAIRAGDPAAPDNTDYQGKPPFMLSSNDLLPNLLIILDNSEYMGNPAYALDYKADKQTFIQRVMDHPLVKASPSSYPKANTSTIAYPYTGLYDNNYFYYNEDGNTGTGGVHNRWVQGVVIRNSNGTFNKRPVGQLPGNLLNWALMSKWDVVRTVAIGGATSNMGGGNESEGKGLSKATATDTTPDTTFRTNWLSITAEWIDYGTSPATKWNATFKVIEGGGTKTTEFDVTLTKNGTVAQNNKTMFAKSTLANGIKEVFSVGSTEAAAGPTITKVDVTSTTTVPTVTTTPKDQCYPAPTASGYSGKTAVIKGSKFGTSMGTVYFTKAGGVAVSASVASGGWADDQITVTVPDGVVTGNVWIVTSGGTASNYMTFTVLSPYISAQYSCNTATTPYTYSTTPAIEPAEGIPATSGSPGTVITVRGDYFGSTQGGSMLTLGGSIVSALYIKYWSQTMIQFEIPEFTPIGMQDIIVKRSDVNGIVNSNTMTLLVKSPTTPTITSITPGSFYRNTTNKTKIEIDGVNFGAIQGTVSLSPAHGFSYLSWTDTKIIIDLDANPSVGVYTATVTPSGSTVSSNSKTFTILDIGIPKIISIAPTSGAVGTAVTVSGENLGDSTNPPSVYFVDGATVTAATITATAGIPGTTATPGTITFTVPASLTPKTYSVKVVVGGNNSNFLSFTVIGEPNTETWTNMKVSAWYAYQTWGVMQELYMINYKTDSPYWNTALPVPGLMTFNGFMKPVGSATNSCIDPTPTTAPLPVDPSAFINSLRKLTIRTTAPTSRPFWDVQQAIDYFQQGSSYIAPGDTSAACLEDPVTGGKWCRKNYVLFVGSGFSSTGDNAKSTTLTNEEYVHTHDLRGSTEYERVLSFYAVSTSDNENPTYKQNVKDISSYGGFTDKNLSKTLNSGEDTTFERKDFYLNTLPDTYYEPINYNVKTGEVEDLAAAIKAAVSDIMKRATSGTAVSVLATSAEGEGALFQAFFRPVNYEGTTPISWIGYLQGLFIDQYGNIREDTDGNKALTATDYIVQIVNDAKKGDAYGVLYNDANGNGVAETSEIVNTSVPLNEIKTIWEAGYNMAKMSAVDSTNGTAVRDIPSAPLSNGRAIFTNISGTTGRVAFDNTQIDVLKLYLANGNVTEAQAIMKFVRGANVEGMRNREMTLKDNTKGVWKLGDIIYSTPTVVSAPMENYDLIYEDMTYYQFYDKHRSRAPIVYAGANDGMLHAFYAGTFNQGDNPSLTGTQMGWFSGSPTGGYKTYPSGTEVVVNLAVPNDSSAYSDLGREVWGYIPQSFLPHLKWQTSTDYDQIDNHVFGVDLKPKVADVRVFTPDTNVHVNGWGTVLIGGMRMGGGDIVANGKTFYSSYFALDITDPFNPTVLWEFSRPDLGMPISYPCIVKTNNAAGTNETWYAIFGTGPQRFESGDPATLYKYHNTDGYFGFSDLSPKLYIVNIKTGAVYTRDLDTTIKGFISNPINIDTNLDFRTDAVYTGAVEEASAPSADPKTRVSQQMGRLYRILVNGDSDPSTWVIKTLFKSPHAIFNAPAVTTRYDTLWLYLSSGRFLHKADKDTTTGPGVSGAYVYEKLYGFKDPCYAAGPYDLSSSSCTAVPAAGFEETKLFDVTKVDVKTDTNKTITNPGDVGLSGTATFDQMVSNMTTQIELNAKYGWQVKLVGPYDETSGQPTNAVDTSQIPTERGVSKPTLIGDVVLFTSYLPSSDICAGGGTGYIYTLYSLTGTAYKNPVIGTATFGGNTVNRKWMKLGEGTPSSISVHMGREKGGKAYVQQSTGAIIGIEFTTAALAKSGFILWREKW